MVDPYYEPICHSLIIASPIMILHDRALAAPPPPVGHRFEPHGPGRAYDESLGALVGEGLVDLGVYGNNPSTKCLTFAVVLQWLGVFWWILNG